MLVLVYGILIFTLLNVIVKCAYMVTPNYQQFTKSDYNFQRMISVRSPYFINEDCKVQKIWLFSTDEIIYSEDPILKEINTKLPPIQESIKNFYKSLDIINKLIKKNKEIITNIMHWKNPINSDSRKNRINFSEKDEELLGGRFKDKFSMFEENFQRNKIEQPTQQTGESITEKTNIENAKDNHINKNISNTTEKIKDILFPQDLDTNNSNREKITDNVVKAMYEACIRGFYVKYYKNNDANQKSDAWCFLFDYKDFKMFEEASDLYYYNELNNSHNKEMAKSRLKEIKNFLSEENKEVKLLVGQVTAYLNIINALGLFKDDKEITSDNISEMNERKWRTSNIAPSGCNIMFVIYDCFYQTKKVSIYLNEIPLEIILNNGNKCKKCPYEEVIQFLESLIM